MDIHDKMSIIRIMVLIALASLGVRLLIEYEFHTSALLYVGLPFLIAVVLVALHGDSDRNHWMLSYWRHTRVALIVMLGSSVVLFEGFMCVLMFMPIYFGVVFLVFIFHFLHRLSLGEHGSGTKSVHILPVLLLASSLEGVSPDLSFERYNEVSRTRTITTDIPQIKRNLQKPMSLGDDMPWFLAVFPMPYDVKAGTLSEGDIHRSEFRYHRWFFTNTHEGHMSLRIAEAGESRIRTEFIKDTSYISNYMTLHGTLIELEPVSRDSTRITLTISYSRKLDPAWYFGPLQRYAVGQTAEYLIAKVIHRQGEQEK